ncbi:MAG: hypothetical protein RJA57_93 [Bacteroidota bacterium]|jgi:inhibitor of KinA
MRPDADHSIHALGDQALTVSFGNQISETVHARVMGLYHSLQERPLRGMSEVVPSYTSLTVFYDLLQLPPDSVSVWERQRDELELRIAALHHREQEEGVLHVVPVCYEPGCAPDLEMIAYARNLTPAELVRIHSAITYRVYLIGFLPGFAYMGDVDERIAAPRKPRPVSTPAGSVGIAGRQTGIYPFDSPGGWNLVGRTPWRLFNPDRTEAPCRFRAGDRVRFEPISNGEYKKLHEEEYGS